MQSKFWSIAKRVAFSGMVAVAPLVFTGCTDSRANADDVAAVAVRTAEVEKVMLAPPIRATGVLAGKAESKLSFKVGGIIDRITVREGQSVQKGQLLATLKLSEIEAHVNQAQNAFAKAERDWERVRNLHQDSVATLEQLQDATTAYEVAKSALDIAKFNRQYASIYAPVSGKVLRRFAEANELINPGTPVLLMRSASDGWVVKTGLADRDIVRIAIGDTARLTLDAYPQRKFSAVVAEISGSAAPTTGTYEVELRIEPTEVTLFSGMIAKVEIASSQRMPVWLVPIAALLEADGMSGNVFTITPVHTAQKVAVEVAFIHGQHVAIASGLDNVAQVVTEGAAYLNEGARVNVVP